MKTRPLNLMALTLLVLSVCSDDLESSLPAQLTPCGYTAILRGENDSSGIGLIEIYNVNE